MKMTKHVPIIAYRDKNMRQSDDLVVQEHALTVNFNGSIIAELLCSPCELHELVIGHLFSIGVIESGKDLSGLVFEREDSVAYAMKSASYAALSKERGYEETSKSIFIASTTVLDSATFDIGCMMENLRQFYTDSLLHKQTAGVHRASLCSDAGTLLTAIDIGRHNAIDKVLGMALIHQIDRSKTYLITSGRVNGDGVNKAVRAGVQMLVSRAAPTAKAIGDAKSSNLTLIGFAREDRFNVYCGEQRLEACAEVTI